MDTVLTQGAVVDRTIVIHEGHIELLRAAAACRCVVEFDFSGREVIVTRVLVPRDASPDTLAETRDRLIERRY